MTLHNITEYGTLDCPVQRVRTELDDDGTCTGCGQTIVTQCGAKNPNVAAVCSKPEGHDLWHFDHSLSLTWEAKP